MKRKPATKFKHALSYKKVDHETLGAQADINRMGYIWNQLEK